MSTQSQEVLNAIKVGYCAERGHPWHCVGECENHFDGAVPLQVVRDYFDFVLETVPVYVRRDGEFGPEFMQVDGRSAVIAQDDGTVFYIGSDGFAVHAYDAWLVGNVQNLLSDELNIGCAALLDNRGVACVQVEMPESITSAEGVKIRPRLLATTSVTGKYATSYKLVSGIVVCDNTLDMAMREASPTFRVKHTRHSALRIADARTALGMIVRHAESTLEFVDALTHYSVSESDWQKMLDTLVPLTDLSVFDGNGIAAPKGVKRAATMAEQRREALDNLYRWDDRAAPWKGSAFGVLQAFNTFDTWERGTRGSTSKVERSMLDVLGGKTAKNDALTLETLFAVTGRELVLA